MDEARTEVQVIGRFLLGAGLGGLVGTGLLALASVVSPVPVASRDGQAETALAGNDRSVVSEPVVAPTPDLPQAPEAVVEPAAPAVTVPAEEPATAESAAAEPAAAEPAAEPAAAPAAAPAVAAPAPLAEAPQPDLATDAPLAPVPADAESQPAAPASAEAPMAPAAPDSPAGLVGDVAPQPAETPAAAPDLAGTAAPEAPSAPEGGVTAADAPATDLAAPASPAEPGQPGVPMAEAAPVVVDLPGPPPLTPDEEALLRQIAEEGPGTAVPVPETAPETAPEAPLPDNAATNEPAPEIAADTPAQPDPAPMPADAPETGPLAEGAELPVIQPEEGQSTLPPAPALTGNADGVTTDRLPRIGEAAAEPAVVASADDRPLALFAQAFDNPDAKPTFAIVLIDTGEDSLDRAALAALPFPVSFALDPTQPKAPEHAAIYRAAGQEVVMLATALPKGAAASDVEVALEAMARALPEAVAVMDTPDRSFQGDRPLATLVVPVIGGQGRGVLTWDQGLNAADQVARREKVPATVAFRDLDGAGEAAPVVRRYLDRAAFKAAQEGHVTVVGRTNPDTVAAILEWTVEGRAATVALAPLSAVLTAD